MALKYAQASFGADSKAATALGLAGVKIETLHPREGDYCYVETLGSIEAPHVLFVGVAPLSRFGYGQIRAFSAKVLEVLSTEAPSTEHIGMTIHGVGYGLDEVESALAQFAGYLDALRAGRIPQGLKRITILELDAGRVERLRSVLDENLRLSKFASPTKPQWGYRIAAPQLLWESLTSDTHAERIENAGMSSDSEPHIFVAMPFKKETGDIYHYGIESPVHAVGMLCTRIDFDVFTGDILQQVKSRIESAAAVVAELTEANPNVYLEVGYAWGKGRPTILLARDSKQLPFDVKGQRCITYDSIKDLEERLTEELKGLKFKGVI